MAKSKLKHSRGPDNNGGDYICPGLQVITPRMPDILFEIERDQFGWTIRTGHVTEEIDFLIGLESMDFQYVAGNPVEAPDLCEEFDDVVDRLRLRFMELDAAEQAQIVSALWDHT